LASSAGPFFGQELAAADLDLHAADPAHAPDDGLCPAMQQAAQQHGVGIGTSTMPINAVSTVRA
jgi:hypothetical protein